MGQLSNGPIFLDLNAKKYCEGLDQADVKEKEAKKFKERKWRWLQSREGGRCVVVTHHTSAFTYVKDPSGWFTVGVGRI